jgi:L-threonylcarbamoyladenylate synthase
LIRSFLPGPLTLVLEKTTVSSRITSEKTSVAIRIPDDSIALALLKKAGPLTVTSANIHNQPTPETIDGIRNMFISKAIVAYIDDGIRNESPSTIVDARDDRPVILRKGSISVEQIDAVVS